MNALLCRVPGRTLIKMTRVPKSGIKLVHKGLLLVFCPLILEFGSFFAVWSVWSDCEQQMASCMRTTRVISLSNDVARQLAGNALNATLFSVTQNPSFKEQSAETLKSLSASFAELKKFLTKESDRDLARRLGKTLKYYITNQSIMMNSNYELRTSEVFTKNSNTSWKEIFESSKKNALEQLLADARDQEVRGRESYQRARMRLQGILTFTVISHVFMAVLLFVLFGRTIQSRLHNIRENTLALLQQSTLSVPVPGQDELAKLDLSLYEAVANIIAAEQFKAEVVGIAGQELRSPLISLAEFTTSLSAGESGVIPPAALVYIERADRNISRLVRLVEDLIDVHEMVPGTMQLHPVAFAVSDLIQSSVEAVGDLAKSKKVQISANCPQIVVTADADRLVQVVVNLLSNAIKFSPPSSAVSICAEQNDDWLTLTVSDSGRGVPENFREKIFQRFEQVESTDASEKGGTGLGLPICKLIIEQHGGTIHVESNGGQGSKFCVRIPGAQMKIAELSGEDSL